MVIARDSASRLLTVRALPAGNLILRVRLIIRRMVAFWRSCSTPIDLASLLRIRKFQNHTSLDSKITPEPVLKAPLVVAERIISQALRSAPLRASRRMGHTHLPVLAAGFCPSCSNSFAPLTSKRAQGRPGARCTRGLVCIDAQRMRTRAYRFSGNTPAFPAQWLYDLYVLSLVTGLSCHHHP